ISHYFQDPGTPYVVGEGGADLGLINQDRPLQQTQDETPTEDITTSQEQVFQEGEVTEDKIKQEMERIESEQLEELKAQLETEINALDSVFQQVKDQILID